MHRTLPDWRLLASLAAVAVMLFAPGQVAAAADDASKVVARVNGQSITEADMDMAKNEIGSDLASLPPEVQRRALAEYLIDNMLFAEAAEHAKLAQTPEFENQMRYLRRRVLRERYFEQTLKSKVGEDEARKIYNARVSQLQPEDEFAARHILVDSEKKAKELRAKIEAGADFAEVAKENSTDPGSKANGGLLGYFTKGQMVPEFEAAVVKMHKGEVSDPVKTAFGWHIIKLEDRRRKPPPSFEDVKDTIMASLVVRLAQEQAAAMRQKAKLEYVDEDIKKQVDEQAKQAAEKPKEPAPAAAPAPDAAPKQ